MEVFFRDLIGRTVSGVYPTNQSVTELENSKEVSLIEGWTIVIGEACLSVFSPVFLERSGQRLSLGNLSGHVLQSVRYEEGKSLTLKFSEGMNLWTDLTPEKYNGPEALVLERPGLPIVVV